LAQHPQAVSFRTTSNLTRMRIPMYKLLSVSYMEGPLLRKLVTSDLAFWHGRDTRTIAEFTDEAQR
jgi:hypothetical protein